MAIKVGVHSGTFHSDELIAIALIRITTGDDIEVVRTRDDILLDSCDILVDVGGIYDKDKNRFDHHQFNETSKFYGLSSAGLVYEKYKSSIAHNEDLDALIEAVDARDTRVGYDESNVYEALFDAITACNSIDIMSMEQDYRFDMILDIVEDILYSILTKDIGAYTSKLDSLERLAESYTKEKEVIFSKRAKSFLDLGEVLVSSFFTNWRNVSKNTGKCIIMKGDKEGQYKIMTDTSKYKIAVVRDEVFTHFNGFIAIAKPTKNSTHLGIALSSGEMIEISLREIDDAFSQLKD